jgi:DNA-binding transcriptional ArsR family regulator
MGIARTAVTRTVARMLVSQTLDKIFPALAHPMRRYIVECLCHGEEFPGELAQRLPLSMPAILKHLRVLEQSGLVRTRKVGRVRTCRLEPESLQLLDRWISDRRRVWDPWLRRLSSEG